MGNTPLQNPNFLGGIMSQAVGMSEAVGNCLMGTWSALGDAGSYAWSVSADVASAIAVNAQASASWIASASGSACSFICSSLSNAASWLGELAARAGAAAQPAIAAIGAFVVANSGTIAIGAACVVGGALLYAAYDSWSNNAPVQGPAQAPAPVAGPAVEAEARV